ncbi:hypothetical protein V8E55_002606 [Tylopilus felleus]
MSSVVSLLETLQLQAYILVAAASVVCYDYTLTSSREVELIWMKPWSVLSTLFVVARYVGLALVIMSGFGSGSGIFYMSGLVSTVMTEILIWTRLIYTVVTDVVINTVIFEFLWDGPHSGLRFIPYLLIHGTYCGSSPVHKQIDFIYDGIPRGLFDILLMVLAIYRFTMHAIETRRMMGRQKINKYMILLLEHSILYFIVNFTYEALATGVLIPSTPPLYGAIVLVYTSSIPFMMYPRLVLDMRGYRATSGSLYIGSEGSGYPRSYGHSKSPSAPLTESGEYELSEGTSPRASQHTRGQSC